MPPVPKSDNLLVDRIHRGEAEAWEELIARYEGRLLAYVDTRLRNRAVSEDVVQETFIGFLTSLPNYDTRRPLEGYLFSIAAHKLTDHMRREGRRPTIPLMPEGASNASSWEPKGKARPASSIMRSGERRGLEQVALADAVRQQIEHWQCKGQWDKLRVNELLFVRGMANKEVAQALGLSEQTVANYKHEFIARLQTLIRKQDLPEEVFPQLYEE